MMHSKNLVICENWALHRNCWRAGVHAKFWHRAEKYGVRVCTVNFGAMQKNVGVQKHMLNLALCGVHTHNKVRAWCA
jgi:hypothetical protein